MEKDNQGSNHAPSLSGPILLFHMKFLRYLMIRPNYEGKKSSDTTILQRSVKYPLYVILTLYIVLSWMYVYCSALLLLPSRERSMYTSHCAHDGHSIPLLYLHAPLFPNRFLSKNHLLMTEGPLSSFETALPTPSHPLAQSVSGSLCLPEIPRFKGQRKEVLAHPPKGVAGASQPRRWYLPLFSYRDFPVRKRYSMCYLMKPNRQCFSHRAALPTICSFTAGNAFVYSLSRDRIPFPTCVYSHRRHTGLYPCVFTQKHTSPMGHTIVSLLSDAQMSAIPPVASVIDSVTTEPVLSLTFPSRPRLQSRSKSHSPPGSSHLPIPMLKSPVAAFLPPTNEPTDERLPEALPVASTSQAFPLGARQRKKKGLCSHCGSPHERDARFCYGCGCSLKTRRETLREFVTKRLFAIRKEEVGSHTMRVERGFWKLILEHLGEIPILQLTSSHWESYLRKLRDRGCSPRTQTLHQIAYQAALKYAVFTQKIAAAHPFRSIKGTTKRTLKTIPLTVLEVYKLLNSSSTQMYRGIFTMGIGLGLRPSEIVRMRWEDVNFEKCVIKIRGTKTKASLTSIPITAIAYKELYAWWTIMDKPKRGLCFFVMSKSKKDPTKLEKREILCFKKALQSAASRAGICTTDDGEQRRIFPYILRHSFATIAATSTPPVPLPVAQAVMRHTSSKMLLETYARAGTLIIKEGLNNFNL
ncbi:site-specific recombinase, phage integrase family protein [Cardiosporidium cionae]|uniref:Site-specific recombinase, phage integrase family protein n=1 Tax=Cardiosporidium cionae TaxID=476202 RepID=A0ABQ7JDS9_9APIC|nr:site-specific recombinase, phage integrase family protein [Cardiosporidium cionae]|eukprot:KAF8822060.1 site-specific recombinase, phage integrase family protein [Cardiosporidium cionae]